MFIKLDTLLQELTTKYIAIKVEVVKLITKQFTIISSEPTNSFCTGIWKGNFYLIYIFFEYFY